MALEALWLESEGSLAIRRRMKNAKKRTLEEKREKGWRNWRIPTQTKLKRSLKSHTPPPPPQKKKKKKKTIRDVILEAKCDHKEKC